MNIEDCRDLPGAELVIPGLKDLAEGTVDSIEGLLVAVGAPRLRSLGIELDFAFPDLPEHELYGKLAEMHGVQAHSRYNALIRRLVSFERALDSRIRREAKTGSSEEKR